MRNYFVLRLSLSLIAHLCAAPPLAAQTSKPTPPSPGRPTPEVRPAAAPVLPEPPLPVQQARAVGAGQCAPILDLMSRQTLTSAYDIQAGWSTSDPGRHIFQAIAALHTPGNTPPDGFAALVAAPVAAGGCDGVSMQVFPLSGDCPAAQRSMLEDGKFVAAMLNTRIMLDRRGNRVVLLPGYNNTCIAIAVDTRFGSP